MPGPEHDSLCCLSALQGRHCRLSGKAQLMRQSQFRCGSTTEVQREPRNVRCWGWSGSRFRAAACLLVAKSGSQGVIPVSPPCADLR